jgi:hypothetical protein
MISTPIHEISARSDRAIRTAVPSTPEVAYFVSVEAANVRPVSNNGDSGSPAIPDGGAYTETTAFGHRRFFGAVGAGIENGLGFVY